MSNSGNLISKVNNALNPYKGLSREIYVIAAARVINAAGTFIFPLLTLILTKKLKMEQSDAGLLLSVSGLLFMSSGIIGGKLADCFGRKKIVIIFNSLGVSCYIIAAFMGMSMGIIPVIALAGFLMSVADPAMGALVADITTPKNRDRAYSLFYISINLGYAVSPIIGGLLFENCLSVLFIADAVTALIAMILIYVNIPETIEKTKEKMGEDRKLEARVEGSIIKVLLKRPVLIFYALVMFGYNFVYSQWGFLYPINAELLMPNNGAQFYGTLVSFNAITVITMTPLITKLLSKKGSLRKIIYGGLLYAVGFGLPGFLTAIPFVYFAVFVLTLGEIVVTTSAMPFIVNRTPASHRGRMNAILPMIMGLGYTIGPTITGSISESLSIGNAWRIVGLIMVTFTVFAVMLERYDSRTTVAVLNSDPVPQSVD